MSKYFDVSLSFGKEGEKWLTLLADEKKLEVKRDKFWQRTGNIFIEYKYKNKPSGISITNAEYFAYILTNSSGCNVAVFIWRTEYLRLALKSMLGSGLIKKQSGGDDNMSEGFIIPIKIIGELTMRCDNIKKCYS